MSDIVDGFGSVSGFNRYGIAGGSKSEWLQGPGTKSVVKGQDFGEGLSAYAEAVINLHAQSNEDDTSGSMEYEGSLQLTVRTVGSGVFASASASGTVQYRIVGESNYSGDWEFDAFGDLDPPPDSSTCGRCPGGDSRYLFDSGLYSYNESDSIDSGQRTTSFGGGATWSFAPDEFQPWIGVYGPDKKLVPDAKSPGTLDVRAEEAGTFYVVVVKNEGELAEDSSSLELPTDDAEDVYRRPYELSITKTKSDPVIDLAIIDFSVDDVHSEDALDLLGVSETIRSGVNVSNEGNRHVQNFSLTFYATPSERHHNVLDFDQEQLTVRMISDGIAPGETRYFETDFFDPIYVRTANDKFSDGYHLGVHVRPEPQKNDADPSDDWQTLNACTPEHLEEDRSDLRAFEIATEVLSAFPGVAGVASEHFQHYFEGSGDEKVHEAGSDASFVIAQTDAFAALKERAIAAIESQLLADYEAIKDGNLPYGVVLSDAVLGRPAFSPFLNPDLFFGIGGTQGSNGTALVEGLLFEDLGNGSSMVSYSGTLSVELKDEYEYEYDDAIKGGLNDEARHLAMCGSAKPFDVRIEVEVPISGFLSVGETGDFDDDGQVGFSDFLQFATNFGKQGENLDGDMDDDDDVDFQDFLRFADNFGAFVFLHSNE